MDKNTGTDAVGLPKRSGTVVFEFDGIMLKDNAEKRAQRMQELRELTALYKKNPEDTEVKKQYFTALK